jgi:hypothetical protein
MKTRIVKRHNCEHCGKGGFHRPAMERHEAGCTANPNRVCKMCLMRARWDEDAPMQKPTAEISALIDSFEPDYMGDNNLTAEMAIRDFVGDCPACLLAGSRQSKNGLPFDFKWKDESKNWLHEYGNHDATYP